MRELTLRFIPQKGRPGVLSRSQTERGRAGRLPHLEKRKEFAERQARKQARPPA